MSRLFRASLAAAALAAVAVPAVASAEPPPPRPFCTLHFTDEPWITTSPDFPVPVSVGKPYWVC